MFLCSIVAVILIFLMFSNGILQICLKLGKLKKDTEEENVGNQFNTVAKNPKVMKDVVCILTFMVNMLVFNTVKKFTLEVPQPYDKSLILTLIVINSLCLITPIIFWLSNRKLRTFAIREFWDQAPIFLIELRNNNHSQEISSNQNQMGEISKEASTDSVVSYHVQNQSDNQEENDERVTFSDEFATVIFVKESESN